MTAASRERAALVSTMRAAGPDAPTLCGDWTTLDLAAHLVLRERRITGAAPELVLFLSGRDVAQVHFTGDDDAVSQVRAARRRL